MERQHDQRSLHVLYRRSEPNSLPEKSYRGCTRLGIIDLVHPQELRIPLNPLLRIYITLVIRHVRDRPRSNTYQRRTRSRSRHALSSDDVDDAPHLAGSPHRLPAEWPLQALVEQRPGLSGPGTHEGKAGLNSQHDQETPYLTLTCPAQVWKTPRS